MKARPLRIAAHLNLSEGRCSAAPHDVPLLVDHQGWLRCSFGSLLLSWLCAPPDQRRALEQQVELEWRAQVRRVQELAAERGVQALDGHIHVHMLPFLFPVAVRVARELGVAEIRVTREPFHVSTRLRDSASPAFLVNLIKHLVLRCCAWRARGVLADSGLAAPDSFVGVLYTGRMSAAAARAGVRAARRAGAQRVEVLFHVGRALPEEGQRWSRDPSLGAFPLSSARDDELRELMRFSERMA